MNAKLDWARDGRDWPNRDASRFVDAGGLRWHVQMAGRGASVLLIHGTGASTHSWRDVFPVLAAHAHVVALDLPGHAFTQTPRARGLTLPGMANAIGDLLVALGVRPALTVGHSAGAAIALRMQLDGLSRSDALLAFNGALKPFPGAAGAVFPTLARLLFMNPFAPHIFAARARDPSAIARLIRQTGSELDRVGLDLYGRLFRSPGHVAATLGMMAQWDLAPMRAELPRVAEPVTLICGDNDRAVPPEDAPMVAALLPRGRVEHWEALGHLAHEERPDRAAEAILAAFKSS